MATATSERKNFFKRLRKGSDADTEQTEMTFMDHLEALRWHLMRSVIVWLAAAILIFVFIDWIYDYIILAPSSEKFITYGALCRFYKKPEFPKNIRKCNNNPTNHSNIYSRSKCAVNLINLKINFYRWHT